MDPKLYRAAVDGNITLLLEVVGKRSIQSKQELFLHNITTQKNNVLHIAVRSSHKEFVKHVFRQCPSLLAQPNSNGETPLHIAAKEGLSEMLYILVQCLSRVIAKGTGELSKMKLLLDEYPSLYDDYDRERGCPLRAVPHILQAPALSVYSSSAGRTPLHQAIIANGVDNEVHTWAETFPEMIKKTDVYGSSPLHYASYFGFSHSVRILLSIDKSSAYEPDKSGMYGHLIAAHKGHYSVIWEFNEHCPDCFELLDNQGRAALHIAVESGQSEIVSFLLEKTHHHINLQDNRGYTPLLLASKNQNECILESLKNHPKVLASDILGRQFETFHAAREMPVRLQFEAESKQQSSTKFCTISRGANEEQGPHIGASTDTKKVMQKVETSQSLEIVCIAQDETSTFQEIKVPQDSKKAMQNVEASETLQLPSKENEVGEPRKDDVSRRLKDKASIHLLVATLIATVSFAAGITMPGGYKSDGMATLTKTAAFQIFVVSNSLAFCFSAASIAIHFMIIIERRVINRAVLLLCALLLTFVALIGMVIAFISGTTAALAASGALWVASSIIGCCFFLVFYVIIGPPFRNRPMSKDVKKLQQAGDEQEKDPSVLVNINELHHDGEEDEGEPLYESKLYKLAGALLRGSDMGVWA